MIEANVQGLAIWIRLCPIPVTELLSQGFWYSPRFWLQLWGGTVG